MAFGETSGPFLRIQTALELKGIDFIDEDGTYDRCQVQEAVTRKYCGPRLSSAQLELIGDEDGRQGPGVRLKKPLTQLAAWGFIVLAGKSDLRVTAVSTSDTGSRNEVSAYLVNRSPTLRAFRSVPDHAHEKCALHFVTAQISGKVRNGHFCPAVRKSMSATAPDIETAVIGGELHWTRDRLLVRTRRPGGLCPRAQPQNCTGDEFALERGHSRRDLLSERIAQGCFCASREGNVSTSSKSKVASR